MATMAGRSATKPAATAEAVGSSEAKARVANAALESGAEKPTVPKGQTAHPKASKGVVRHAIRPRSPLVVPPSMVEEEEVEEIEREES